MRGYFDIHSSWRPNDRPLEFEFAQCVAAVQYL